MPAVGLASPAAPDRSGAAPDGPWSGVLWALPAVLAAAAVHAPVLRFWFYSDDLLHLFQLGNLGLAEFVLKPHGGHLYVVRNLVFALAHAVFGLDAGGYMALLLLHHLFNVVLLFAVLRGFFGSNALAGFGALLWGAGAVQRGVLGWYSAHGIAMVTSVLLWLLLDLSRIRRGELRLGGRRIAAWAALLLGGALCYGIGVALALAFPWIARLLLPAGGLDRRAWRALLGVALATPVLYAGLYWALPAAEGSTRAAGLQLTLLNPFSWPYTLRLLLHMLAYGAALLLLGPLATLGYDEPLSGAFAAQTIGVGPLAGLAVQQAVLPWSLFGLACAAGLVWLAVRAPKDQRRLLLGFLLVALVGYGMIAVGRTFWGIMLRIDAALLATTPRYQYVGSVALCLALCWALRRLPLGRWAAVAGAAWALAFVALSLPAASRVSPPDPRTRPEFEAFWESLDAAARATPEGETLYLRNRRFVSGPVDARRPEVFPGWLAAFVLSQPGDTVAGRPVRFVEADRGIVEALRAQPDTRAARLVLTEEECRGCGAR